MSTPKWKKRWLYDSKVEIPKTTKWRRSSEVIEPAVDDNFRLRDARQDLVSSETIGLITDLGNNISPLKKRRILGDCLSRTQTKSLLLSFCLSETKVNDVELDLQTPNAKADECGVDSFDYTSKKQTEIHELLHYEGEKFLLLLFLLFSFTIGPYI